MGGVVAPESLFEKVLVCQKNWHAVNDTLARADCILREAKEARKMQVRMESVGEGRCYSHVPVATKYFTVVPRGEERSWEAI